MQLRDLVKSVNFEACCLIQVTNLGFFTNPSRISGIPVWICALIDYHCQPVICIICFDFIVK